MGTVGLAFGSATGGTGFDVASTVSQILAIQQGIETPWKTQLTTLGTQDSALTAIGKDLSTLTTNLQALTDFNGVFAQKLGSSSDTNTIALTSATASAAAGGHDVTVQRLAQTSTVYSDAVSASDVLSGSLSIQVGSGTAQTIAVPSTANTLSGLSAAINAAGIGVVASVIGDGSGQRLTLVSATSGAAGQLTVSSALSDTTSGSAVATQSARGGQDAQLTVDGIALTSASNTVSSAIPGVTFQLLNTSSAAVQVQITNDTNLIASAVSAFVTAYNAVVNDISTQEGKDASGNAEPLYGSPTLSLLQTQLSASLLGGAGSSGPDPLTLLGLTLVKDGTISVSQSALEQNLGSNFSGVVSALQDAGSFGANFNTALNGLGSVGPSGAIYLALQQDASEEKSLNDSVSDEDARIAAQKISLTDELNTANQILQAIPSQLSEVDEMYSAITGYNQKS